MGDPVRSVYFPLRSNAYGMLRGAPIVHVRRRLKLASLLFDEVLLEDGRLSIVSGEGGYFEFPLGVRRDGRWQSANERNKRVASMAFRADSDPSADWTLAPFIGKPVLNWEPSFLPFVAELPPEAAAWVHFGNCSSEQAIIKQAALSITREDAGRALLAEMLPDPMARGVILGHVGRDIATASLLGSAISVDSMHRNVLHARVLQMRDSQVGGAAMQVLFPRVEDLPWSAIAEFRSHRDIVYFRGLLREVEADAIRDASAASASGAHFERSLRTRYERAVTEAERRLAGTQNRKIGLGVVCFVIGELASLAIGTPGVAGLVSGAIGYGLGEATERVFRPRWRAADRALQSAIQRTTELQRPRRRPTRR